MLRFELPWRVSGTGAPGVIQGPGWGPPADYLWETLVPALPPLRLLLYDVRNTGRAPRRRQPGSQATAGLVADLGRVSAAAGFSRFVLVGHSHGGAVAAAFAALYPDRVGALLLIAPVLPGGHRADFADARLTMRPRDAEEEAALRRYCEGPGSIGRDEELARWMRQVLPVHFHDRSHVAEFARRLRGAPRPSAAAWRGMPAVVEPWVLERLPTVTAPTLVLTGRFDVVAPVVRVERVRALIPGARLVVLERSGHHPWVEEPERFRATVAGFLAAAAVL